MYVCDMMYVLGFMKADNGDIEKKEIYNILYCWTFTCGETLSIYQMKNSHHQPLSYQI